MVIQNLILWKCGKKAWLLRNKLELRGGVGLEEKKHYPLEKFMVSMLKP
jgi:hypothetical protein